MPPAIRPKLAEVPEPGFRIAAVWIPAPQQCLLLYTDWPRTNRDIRAVRLPVGTKVMVDLYAAYRTQM